MGIHPILPIHPFDDNAAIKISIFALGTISRLQKRVGTSTVSNVQCIIYHITIFSAVVGVSPASKYAWCFIRSNSLRLYVLSDYSTCCTNRVFTRSVHQPRVYAFGVPTTRLRVWCTYKALTNQGDASVYRLYSLPQ